MAIKGLGGSKEVNSISQKSSASKSDKFGAVLDSKKQTISSTKNDRVKSMTPQTVKGRLAELMQGGAPTKQVVAQALSNNPLFRNLPASLKEDLLKKVSEQMDPLLGRVS